MLERIARTFYPEEPNLLTWLVVAVNVLGGIYGIFWYRSQLAATPPALWLLVADSPLSVLAFAVVLTIRLSQRLSRGQKRLQLPHLPDSIQSRPALELLSALTFIGLIKYGLWAAVIVVAAWLRGSQATGIMVALVVVHLGMVFESVVFLKALGVARWAATAAPLWFVLNDTVDYMGGLHPTLPDTINPSYAASVAVGLTLLSSLYVSWAGRDQSDPK